MRYYLVDNGSLRADSWNNLAFVAAAVSRRTGRDVRPASVLHSDKLDPAECNGQQPVTLEQAIRRDIDEGMREFGVIPFFFGPSRAITRYVPERIEALRAETPDLKVSIAPFLFDCENEYGDTLASILAERVRETIHEQELDMPPVVLVDHGSPVPVVTRVRDYLAGQLSVILRGEVRCVGPASMERREGALYKFNEPLLEKRLDRAPYNSGDVVISLLFLSPGRHAGEGGDIAAICADAEARNAGLRTHITGLAGTHPLILDIVERRMDQVAAQGSGAH